jgi:hypothetical protein
MCRMSGEEVQVATLSGKMDMVIDMLKELQKDLKSNYMPSAQIEDRFRAHGERIGAEEKARIEDIKMIRGTLEKMDQDVKDKFAASEIKNSNNETIKRESPFKVIAAFGVLVGIIGTVTGGLIWLIHIIK